MGTGSFTGIKSGQDVTLTPHPSPPLPLWAVRPVQSLIACTMVHFTFYCNVRVKQEHQDSDVAKSSEMTSLFYDRQASAMRSCNLALVQIRNYTQHRWDTCITYRPYDKSLTLR